MSPNLRIATLPTSGTNRPGSFWHSAALPAALLTGVLHNIQMRKVSND